MSDSHASSALAHQFEDLQQQQESASLGMWVFLATEVMFFGGLFAGYTIYRNLYLPGFEEGSHLLNVTIGAINTAVLIGSSLTMAMAVRAAQMGKRNALVTFLILTIILGLVFVGVKLNFEWRHDYIEGLAPGLNFTHEPDSHQARKFRRAVFLLLLHHDRRPRAAYGDWDGNPRRPGGAGMEGAVRTGSLQYD